MTMKRSLKYFLALISMLLIFSLSACEGCSREETMEEKIEEAAEDTGEAIEEGAEEVEDAVEEGAVKVEEIVEEGAEEAEDTVDGS